MNSTTEYIRQILEKTPNNEIKVIKASVILDQLQLEGHEITPSTRSMLSLLLKKEREKRLNLPQEIEEKISEKIDEKVKYGLRFVFFVGNIEKARKVLDKVEQILTDEKNIMLNI